MVSVHTSPLDQPGTGDAGGMNVYVVELAQRLAAARRRGRHLHARHLLRARPDRRVGDGVTVHNIHAGPFEGLTKGELPGQLCVFAREVLRTEAARRSGHYDVVHSHYWLSGQVGALARDRWGVPLVHSMHTMAKVKNDAMADGDTPEPAARIIGEEQVVEAADMLIASTDIEAKQLVNLYDADPARVEVVHPGVDLTCSGRATPSPRARSSGSRWTPHVVLFAGRIQPLKAPDVLLRAVALPARARPRRCGPGSSCRSSAARPGTGLEHPESLAELAAELGIADVVRFVPPVRRPSSPCGTPPRRWSPCRPTTSRSGWSPSRRRPPARRSWRPPSGG